MGFNDSWNYVVSGNPISKAAINASKGVVGGAASMFSRKTGNGAVNTVSTAANDISKIAMPSLFKLAGRNHNFMRLAGLSGASAVILGAVGSHSFIAQEKNENKTIFETANRFHFFHALALMGAPMTRYPVLTGLLMISGTFLFCGTLYYRAFTGDKTYARYAPIGGTCLILAWLSMIL